MIIFTWFSSPLESFSGKNLCVSIPLRVLKRNMPSTMKITMVKSINTCEKASNSLKKKDKT